MGFWLKDQKDQKILHLDKNQIDSNPGFLTQELLKCPHSVHKTKQKNKSMYGGECGRGDVENIFISGQQPTF